MPGPSDSNHVQALTWRDVPEILVPTGSVEARLLARLMVAASARSRRLPAQPLPEQEFAPPARSL